MVVPAPNVDGSVATEIVELTEKNDTAVGLEDVVDVDSACEMGSEWAMAVMVVGEVMVMLGRRSGCWVMRLGSDAEFLNSRGGWFGFGLVKEAMNPFDMRMKEGGSCLCRFVRVEEDCSV